MFQLEKSLGWIEAQRHRCRKRIIRHRPLVAPAQAWIAGKRLLMPARKITPFTAAA